MRKRLLVFLLATLVLLSGVFVANAETVRTSGVYTYRLKGNGTAVIVGFDWKKNSGDIYIPSMIDGYTVTTIGDEAFAYGKDVSGSSVIVVIPNTITMIGEKAFFKSPVSAINIPSSLQSIGKGAFAYCNISHFSAEPGHSYFATIDGVLYNKKTKTLVAYPQNSRKCIAIPEGIVKVDDWACAGTSLGSFEYEATPDICQFSEMLPSTVKEIGDYAFADCVLYYTRGNNLLKGNTLSLLPDGVVKIGSHSFENSMFAKAYYKEQAPDQIEIGASIVDFGAYAFADCRWYDGNEFNLLISGYPIVEYIGEYAFANAVIGSDYQAIEIILPACIRTIGAHAFESTYCINAKKWIDSEKVFEKAFYNTTVYCEKTIGEYYQETPAKLTIPGTLKTISCASFATKAGNVSNTITEVHISDGTEHIGEFAFTGMTALQKISLPDSLLSIGKEAFTNCLSLAEVAIPASVEQIGDNAFERTKVTLCVEEGSYAALWASENGYSYTYSVIDDLDWLNN